MDEFDTLERLFRPLAADAPEAFGLMDDAAALPSRPGLDLIVTTDTLVEGVHFLPDDPPDLIARKLLRVNLSDLAAKGAEPYGYFLNLAWAPGWDEARRTAFARGLALDQAGFGLKLFGGDTVSTPGPLVVGATLMGWVPAGRMVKRSGARAGDVLLVSGTIGDGGLGLRAARGELTGEGADWLADRYRLPQPRLALRQALLDHASAAADVSDGLLADALHLAEASGARIEVELERTPVSDAAVHGLGQTQGSAESSIFFSSPRLVLGAHPPSVPPGRTDRDGPQGQTLGRRGVDSAQGLSVGDVRTLATSGDDYEIVCTCSPAHLKACQIAAEAAGVPLTVIGRVMEGKGLYATFHGEPVALERLGWRHG